VTLVVVGIRATREHQFVVTPADLTLRQWHHHKGLVVTQSAASFGGPSWKTLNASSLSLPSATNWNPTALIYWSVVPQMFGSMCTRLINSIWAAGAPRGARNVTCVFINLSAC